jgi:hypothetical protein
LLHDD